MRCRSKKRKMMKKTLLACAVTALLSCHNTERKPVAVVAAVAAPKKAAICCEKNIPARFPTVATPLSQAALVTAAPTTAADKWRAGMVWIPGGRFKMGADSDQALEDEYPKHTVTVSGFWIDRTEVTNAQFAVFVKATGYVTTAERKPDWNELKKQLPAG